MISTHEIGRIDSLIKTVNLQFSLPGHPRMDEIQELGNSLHAETHSGSVARGQQVNGVELFRIKKGVDLSMVPLALEDNALQLVKFTTQQRVDRCQHSRCFTMVRFVFVSESRLNQRWPEFEAKIPQIEAILADFCTQSLWTGRGYDNPSGDEEAEMRFISLNFEFPGPREKHLKSHNGALTGEVRQLTRARLCIDQGLVSVEPI